MGEMERSKRDDFRKQYLDAIVEQRRVAMYGNGDPDSIEKDHVAGYFTDDYVKLDVVMGRLAQPEEEIECRRECMCRYTEVYLEMHAEKQPRSEPKQIIGHRFHGGTLFLLCVFHSEYTRPEYRRLCQVPLDVRLLYAEYLRENKRPPDVKEFWDIEKESELVKRLFEPLDEKQKRQQEELRLCSDTKEWEHRTKNGINCLPLPPPSDTPIDKPPPAMETAKGEKFYEVEAILGALLEKGSGKLWFLVKWKGYPHEENTWETWSAVQMSQDLIKKFYEEYGRPSKQMQKVLSPDGLKFQKWCDECEKTGKKNENAEKKKKK